MTIPKKISLIDASRILNLPMGILARDLKAKCATGLEPVPTAKVMKHFKLPSRLFSRLLSGDDKLLRSVETAALLGLKPTNIKSFHPCRPLIVPATHAGSSPWGGNRYALSAVKGQIEMDRLAPPEPRGAKAGRTSLPGTTHLSAFAE